MFALLYTCRYENKGVQWLKSKPTGPIGLVAADTARNDTERTTSKLASATETASPTVPLSKSAKKNQKRREKKKQQQVMKNEKKEKYIFYFFLEEIID